MKIQKDNFIISTDKEKFDIKMIYEFLSQSYWANNRTLEQVKESIKHSLCFGVYQSEAQIGFARIITDYSTFSYLVDVFIIPEFRGLGLGKWLVETIFSLDEVKSVRCMLLTTDAHKIYEQVDFTLFPYPERVMIKMPVKAFG
jgi:GNAT superfamily N-acetyltransferase